MKIPARHYRITLLCSLLVLSGFTIYAPASQTGRLSAALEDRGLITEILSL